MKTILTCLAFVLCISTYAQEDKDGKKTKSKNEIRTIFGEVKSNGGFLSYSAKYNRINGKDAFVSGGRGGWVINNSFVFGVGGNGFRTEAYENEILGGTYLYKGGYGGLLFEPTIKGKSSIHITIPILIGAGGISYSEKIKENRNTSIDDNYEDQTAFVVVEPGIELEFNLLKYLRMGVGAYYRYTSNINLNYKDPKSGNICSTDILQGLSYGLTIKIGKF